MAPTVRALSISLTLATSAALLAACSSSPAAEPAPTAEAGSTSGVTVVATTTMLGDVAGRIATCGGGSATTLMPIGTDPHDFSASSEQVADMVGADLVVINGLGLEASMQASIDSAASDGARILAVGDGIDPLLAGKSGAHADEHADEHAHDEHADEHAHDEHADEHAHDHGEFDPHFWLDMQRMATAAGLIGEELAEITGEAEFRTCGESVAAEILAAEAEVTAVLESVPVERRVLVTDHDAYAYLADRYGYEVVGSVIPSTTTLAEPSSADLAELAATMQAEGVDVIFADVAAPTALAEAVAAETGNDVRIIPLYSGSLGGPDSPAATYIDFMRANAALIAEGLAG